MSQLLRGLGQLELGLEASGPCLSVQERVRRRLRQPRTRTSTV